MRIVRVAIVSLAVMLSSGLAVAEDDESQQDPKPARADRQERRQRKDDEASRDQERKAAPQQSPAAAQQPSPGAPRQPAGAPRQPARRDRVSELLDKLDPGMLQLSGADLNVEIVNGQIVIVGNENDVKAVEAILRLLDEATPPKDLEVVQVTERDAKEIATTLQAAIREKERNRPQEEQSSVSAVSSNIVLVTALPEDIPWIVDLIHKIDEVPDVLKQVQDMQTFAVKNRKASDVATQLSDILKKINAKRGITGEKGELVIIPNNANNTIVVLAPESDKDKIQEFINQLDVEPVKGRGINTLTLFPLQHSKATELAEVLEKLLKTQAQGGGDAAKKATEEVIQRLILSRVGPDGKVTELPPIDLGREIKIIPDEGTQSLIVATAPENVEPMGELIRLLDGVPLAADLDVRLFPLRFADAKTVSESLKSMFEEAKKLPEDPGVGDVGAVPESAPGRPLVYNIGFAEDARTNTLIVSGRAEQLQLVEKIIRDLDRPANDLKFPLRMIALKHTDATRIGEMIKKLLEKRMEAAEATDAGAAALERDRVFLTVDVRSNILIVSASKDNFEEIKTIVDQLDTEPVKGFDQVRIVTAQRLSVVDLKEKIDELWQRKAQLMGAQELPEDAPVIAVDERSNSLLIAAAQEDFLEIKRLIEALETQPMVSDTRMFKLAYADAKMMSDKLDKLFEAIAGQSEGFKAPAVIPDERSNTLVVAGTQDAIERVDFLVRRLDVEAGPTTATFKVYPLRYTSAGKAAQRMQALFDARKEGEEGARTPIAIFAAESSNSLVVSASRDDHETIIELIGLLDKPSNIARQFEIFPLKFGKAAAIAEKLKTLFESTSEGSTGRQDVIGAEADERTNSIIVWAAPSEMQNIGEVIEKLDTSTPTSVMAVKLIQLKQALAEDFATLLTDTVLGEGAGTNEETAVILSVPVRNPDGSIEYRKMLRQDIKVKADQRTNSLIVSAPEESMAMLETMIQEFDRVRPIRSEVRLFPLINSDAEAIVEKLTELFMTDEGGGGEGVKSQLFFGDMPIDIDMASVGQDLRFTADTRTNTLIAAGAEVDLRMVEELVRYLDSQEAEDRVLQVIPVSYTKPEDIASAIKSFNDQEQEALGAVEDAESQRVKAERQVSIEAVTSESGSEGGASGSSTLIVGTSRRKYDQTMAMIRELDRPEPQVMISVLIAEVTLTNNVELGIEIAGRDLDFSDSAVMGPNGVIQGPDFDWVSGTNLGAVGSGLGFNFTVTGEDFSFLLHALQGDSRLEILSRPVLVVRNGEEGKISIADEIPFVESSQINDTGSVNSSVTREDVGIILTTTPHISPDGYVTIELKQEISNFSGENLQLTEGVSSPIISKREVDTNVTVRDGETVVIGGLITSRESEGENKVPILGDIPILGLLARSKSVSNQKTELLMVLTVDVIRTDEDRRRLSIEQRDKFVLPDSIRQSPLMEGLRITPEEAAMGPKADREFRNKSSKIVPKSEPTSPDPSRPPQRDLYGPRPKTYGPAITPPQPTTSTASASMAYGPNIVRNAPAHREEPMSPTPATDEDSIVQMMISQMDAAPPAP